MTNKEQEIIDKVKADIKLAAEKKKQKEILDSQIKEILSEHGPEEKMLFWDLHFQQLLAFNEEQGHFDVPAYYTIDGIELGKWVERQKKVFENTLLHQCGVHEQHFYTGGEFELLEDDNQYEKLLKIGFRGITLEWSKYIKSFETFKKEFGHTLIPSTYKDKNGLAVGSWLARERMKYFEGSMETINYEMLSNLDCIWNTDIRLQVYSRDDSRSLASLCGVDFNYDGSIHNINATIRFCFEQVKGSDDLKTKINKALDRICSNPVALGRLNDLRIDLLRSRTRSLNTFIKVSSHKLKTSKIDKLSETKPTKLDIAKLEASIDKNKERLYDLKKQLRDINPKYTKDPTKEIYQIDEELWEEHISDLKLEKIQRGKNDF